VGRSGTRAGRARAVAAALVLAAAAAGCDLSAPGGSPPGAGPAPPATAPSPAPAGSALDLLATVPVRGRAPRTGYARERFGPAWADTDRNGCDTRNDVLARDLADVTTRPGTDGCVVLAGTLVDPYTGRTIRFSKQDADAVQIDHVVSLSDAWQKGAARWPAQKRLAFANDPLELLAVDGPTNGSKSDSDAASWLPPSRPGRCRMVAHQVAVKAKYGLWVTAAEREAMARVLTSCPSAAAPASGHPTTAPLGPRGPGAVRARPGS